MADILISLNEINRVFLACLEMHFCAICWPERAVSSKSMLYSLQRMYIRNIQLMNWSSGGDVFVCYLVIFIPTLSPNPSCKSSSECFSRWAVDWIRSRGGELQTQKLKSHLVRIQSLYILPLKPGVGQYIAIHATLTARDFFLAYFYPSGPFTCILPKPLPTFPVLAMANTWFLCRPAE